MSLESVLTFLTRYREGRIALVSHQRPDGDAIGSCLGLARILRGAGWRVEAVNLSPRPKHYDFLSDEGYGDYGNPDWHRHFDCIGVLDCGEIGRLDGINQPAVAALPCFNIDHHLSSPGVGQAVWNEPATSSVGEMIVTLATTAGWPFTPPAAQALWTAIATDTGRFSFENTTPTCLEAAARCVAAGATPPEVTRHVFDSVSLAERRLQAIALTRLDVFADGRLALTWLVQDDFAKAGSGVEGAQDIINLVRGTAGVEVAMFLYEIPGDASTPASVKISLRTVAPHDALTMATRFGGGGHKRAAGCSLEATMEEAKATAVATALHDFFPDHTM